MEMRVPPFTHCTEKMKTLIFRVICLPTVIIIAVSLLVSSAAPFQFFYFVFARCSRWEREWAALAALTLRIASNFSTPAIATAMKLRS